MLPYLNDVTINHIGIVNGAVMYFILLLRILPLGPRWSQKSNTVRKKYIKFYNSPYTEDGGIRCDNIQYQVIYSFLTKN